MRGSSERTVLICEECGKRTVLIGPRDTWHSEEGTVFECECGERSTLASGPGEAGPRHRTRQRSFVRTLGKSPEVSPDALTSEDHRIRRGA